MNPERIYQQHREDALARQIAAAKYSTFVAMPFRDSFSYRSEHIYKEVIQKAALIANQRRSAEREFDEPKWVKDGPGSAIAITEEIVVRILENHLFLADLTLQNAGVVLETGLAFGLKPNRQIILLSQGNDSELHFDLKINHVIFYQDDSVVENLADALIAAAKAFEEDSEFYVGSVVKALSSPAIKCLRWFGEARKSIPHQSLHEGIAARIFQARPESEAILLFQIATQELIERKLLYMHFEVRQHESKEIWGAGATELGWAVIEKLWPQFARHQI